MIWTITSAKADLLHRSLTRIQFPSLPPSLPPSLLQVAKHKANKEGITDTWFLDMYKFTDRVPLNATKPAGLKVGRICLEGGREGGREGEREGGKEGSVDIYCI